MRVLCCGLLLAAIVGLTTATPGVGADDPKTEEGFTPLFNGKDLTGWKMKKGGASLDAKTEAANNRFKVADGILVIDPAVKGDVTIESAKTFEKDVHLKFEFLPDAKCNNDLFLRGIKFDIKKPDVKFKEGEWQLFEIVLKGDKAEFKLNGETIKTVAAKPGATPLGVRAEIGAIQIRNARYKEGS